LSHSQVNQCVAIARLPEFVLQLFANPTEIQVRWAKLLNDQLQADPETLADRAKKIKALGKSFASSKLVEMLIGVENGAVKSQTTPIKHEGKVIGKIQRGTDGDVALTIQQGFLSEAAFAQFQKYLAELIGK
jgi:ParB family chromosome partitioning protein